MFHTHDTGVGRRALIAGGAGLLLAGASSAGTPTRASASSPATGDPVPPDVYAAICQLKANYVTATDSLPFPSSEDRARALYRATYAPDAVSSAGYDAANPDFTAIGPDGLFEVLHPGLQAFSGSQHNVGVIHVELSNARRARDRVAMITAHVLVTLVSKATMDITRIVATYHDEAENRRGRWWVTTSFAQYLATETATRVAPPITP
jgi:hypothetical protein